MINRACILLICLCPATGWSDDTERAKRLFHAAERSFAERNFAKAMETYNRAYRAKALPGFLFNIGQCHRALGNYREAIRYFRTYLRQAPNGRHREHAEELIELCTKRLSELPRSASRHKVRAPDAPSRKDLSNPMQASDDETPADLRRKSTPAVATRKRPVSRTAPQPSRQRRRRLHPVYFWSALGATASLLVTTATTGGLALSKSSRYKDPQTAQNELRALRDSGRGLKTAATVAAVLGAVSAAGTAALYFFTDFRARRDRLQAAILPNAAMIGWSESF